jgi:alkyldihydroxyacetonephosphate synthase
MNFVYPSPQNRSFIKNVVLNELIEALGAEKVSHSEIDRTVYSRDSIVQYSSPLREEDPELPRADFVCFPETAEEVSRIIRIANTHRVPVVPECGGAQGSGSTLPLYGGIVLDVKGLKKIIDIDTANHTVTAQTGLIGYELESALNAVGFTCNHLPQSLHVSGLGGFISARSAGVISTKYGKITEMVLGMEVVLPTGEIISTKRVPNSAAGPNFNYLFMGAEGTLGVITEVTLRITPLPESRKFLGVLFADLPTAIDGARLIMRRGLWPAAMRINDEIETLLMGKEGCQMVLMFDGFEELTELELKETKKIIQKLGGADLGEEPARKWWEEKRFTVAFPTSDHPLFGISKPGHIRMSGCIDSAGSFDYLVNVHRGLKEIVEGMNMILIAHFSHWYTTGGMIYPTFLVELQKGPDAARAYNEVWRRGIELSHRLGGTINHHHGIGLNLGRFMKLELGEAGLENFRRIKRAMDPNNIMNPGKLGL